MSEHGPHDTPLTKAEKAVVRVYADKHGISEDEAATQLFQTCLARRVKKKTGKVQARVYSMRKPK